MTFGFSLPEIAWCEIRAVFQMNKSCDSEAMKILECLMCSGIVKMEESVPEMSPRTIPRAFFIEIDQNFLDKELTVDCFLWW
jgi:hypothetical protein